MESPRGSSNSLFDVYLRLRPPHAQSKEPFVELDEETDGWHSHITIKPPASDTRKRAIEKFGFTRVFVESTPQAEIFHGISLLPQLEGLLAPDGKPARDGLLATLGVTGSGKVGSQVVFYGTITLLTHFRVIQSWDQRHSVASPN